jgi:hypothetical protein
MACCSRSTATRHRVITAGRGRAIKVRIAGSPLGGADGSAAGAILLMEQDGITQSDEVGAEKPGGQDGETSMVDGHDTRTATDPT